MQALSHTRPHHGLKRTKILLTTLCMFLSIENASHNLLYSLLLLPFSATLFSKSKNPLLALLFADVIEEEGGGKGGGGKKKGGGSMQTISATHRVCVSLSLSLLSVSNNK